MFNIQCALRILCALWLAAGVNPGLAQTANALAPSKTKSVVTENGINISGNEYYTDQLPQAVDWYNMKKYNIKTIRLPIAWENYQSTLNGVLNSVRVTNLISAIEAGAAQGVSTVVDIHNGGCYIQSAKWGPMSHGGNGCVLTTGVNILGDGTLTLADYDSFVGLLSEALKGTPGYVGLDLMSEPSLAITGASANLLSQPNGFGDLFGCPNCWTNYSATLTQLGPQTNPVNANGSPAWSINFKSNGYGAVGQAYKFSPLYAYTFSCYAQAPSGSALFAMAMGSPFEVYTATATWQRFSFSEPAGVVTGTQIAKLGGDGVANAQINIADCQLEASATASAYSPGSWFSYLQSAIATVRANDAKVRLYVESQDYSCAYTWLYFGADLLGLSDPSNNLEFEAHWYGDIANTPGCGPGSYSPATFSSYYPSDAAAQANAIASVAPFVQWKSQYNVANATLGEIGAPNTSDWLAMSGAVEANLASANMPVYLWLYNTNDPIYNGFILNVAPVNGKTDPRITQLTGYK